MSHNPYSPPQGQPQEVSFNLAAAKSKLTSAGIAITVIGSIGLLLGGGYTILCVIVILGGEANINPPPEFQEGELPFFESGTYGLFVLMLLNSLFQILVILGGIAMVSAKWRGIAIMGAVASIIPCLSSSVCFAGIPFGIWALVVLSDPDVKQAFK